jgi:hypothetical protein
MDSLYNSFPDGEYKFIPLPSIALSSELWQEHKNTWYTHLFPSASGSWLI